MAIKADFCNNVNKSEHVNMRVEKRDGSFEEVCFDKISRRLKSLSWAFDSRKIDYGSLVREVVVNMSDQMKTEDIDRLAASVCVNHQLEASEYDILATRLLISNLHKQTDTDVLKTYRKIKDVLDPSFYAFVETNADALQEMICYERDYDYDYFGASTITRLYCAKKDGVAVERPAHVYLRTACVVTKFDLERTRHVYDMLSRKHAVFGSPTLFNSGMKMQQVASCFLLEMHDSIEGIFDTFHEMARISKLGGGIGVFAGNVRSRGAPITSTNGRTDGLLPMVRCVNSIAQYVNQSSKRKGAVAVYLGVDHPDLMDILDIRRPGGDENLRARDLFLGLMISDLFMSRLETGGTWSFFDPFECPGLPDAVGDEYVALYEGYESAGKAKKTMPAKDVFNAIIRAQIESGIPYILYKDAINLKSNQRNLGTIKTSNLCAEIVQYTSPEETAVCNLGSICLPAFVRVEDGTIDYDALMGTARQMTRCLNNVIDINHYPCEKAKTSNMRHRPIGLGIQGLADVFVRLGISFDSERAVELSRKLAAAIYYASVDESAALAQEEGPYSTYAGSPMSLGQMQFDLWGVQPDPDFAWSVLKDKVKTHGVRNSLNIAIMPTASTAQICGNIEAAEPITSLVYVRRTLAGEHVCVYKHLVNDLTNRGLWTEDLRNEIVNANGSIQGIRSIPDEIKRLYVTAYDIKQRWIIDHAVARGPYVCQTQSMNIFMAKPSASQVAKSHRYGHARGIKTGVYYLRTKSAVNGAQVSRSHTTNNQTLTGGKAPDHDSEEDSVCLNCSG